MSVFSELKTYEGKWSVKSSAKLDKADVKSITEATVVSSEYGLSAKVLTAKGTKYIPISRDSILAEGDDIEPSAIVLIVLSKEGESDIVRLDVE